MSHSAPAVSPALLSLTNRANSPRLLRSTCVSTQRFDGAVPTAVSDSKWPNPRRESTRFGLSPMGARIGMRGLSDLLPLARVRCRLPLGRYRLRSDAFCGLAWIHW